MVTLPSSRKFRQPGGARNSIAFLLVGTIAPLVPLVVCGLMNEGFRSLEFLIYPSEECVVVGAALMLGAVVLVRWRDLADLRWLDRMGRFAALAAMSAAASLTALGVASCWLPEAVAGTPRKFFVFEVAPRFFDYSLFVVSVALVLLKIPRCRKTQL